MADTPDPPARGLQRAVQGARELGRDAVARLRASPTAPGPADQDRDSAAESAAPRSDETPMGMQDPRELAQAIPLVERAFAFIDICGFTAFTAEHGEHAAITALRRFRTLTREVATRRGVRVAKWLGDGVMLVGVEVGPTIAAATELIARYDVEVLPLRGGVAHGWVLLFEGDDYIGRPANLAARLCDAAAAGEVLALGYGPRDLPGWVEVKGTRDITVHGLGRIRRVQRLGVRPDVELPTLSVPVVSETRARRGGGD